jgi:hypothetical protein
MENSMIEEPTPQRDPLGRDQENDGNCARCEKPGPYVYLCEECLAEDARKRAEGDEYIEDESGHE